MNIPFLNSFFNTTKLKGSELQQATVKAIAQDKDVLKMMKHLNKAMTAHEVWIAYNQTFKIDAPRHSILRAVSNLYSSGLIDKSGDKVISAYGRKVNRFKAI